MHLQEHPKRQTMSSMVISFYAFLYTNGCNN